MVSIVVSGMILGFAIAILVGPVFFLLLNTALRKGWLPAIYIALGVAISDIIYILAIYLGFSRFENSLISHDVLIFAGGVLLIAFGLVMIGKKIKIEPTDELVFTNKERIKYLSRGFMLNFINPSVIIFWIGAVSAATIKLENNSGLIFVFFTATMLTVFLFDVFKIYLSRKLSAIITEKSLRIINIVSGIAMVIYGFYLLVF
ncbi:MAG: hypothetical protein EAZ53_13035 [Bacteroidetes bacterium]|nr:MAG: hypothetical protein EAZ53_13035 [Bacteroidota bacterium]